VKSIIYIANIRLPTEKAHGIQIMKMCEAIADLGIAVELVVPRRLNKIKTDPFEYYSVKRNFKLKQLPFLDLIRFGRIGFWIQSVIFAELTFLFVLWRRLQNKTVEFYTREELVAFHLQVFDIPVVWEAHTGKDNFLTHRLVRKGVKIVCISKGIANFFKKLGAKEENILVAHDGVDLSLFETKKGKREIRRELGLPEESKIVSYVGKYKTNADEKGVDGLIETFGLIDLKFLNSQLMLVGINEDEKEEVVKVVKRAGIDINRVLIIGHVHLVQVSKYLMASDILVMNYPDSYHYANFMSPLKLFEYMASGVPIVTSDLPSIREVVSDSEVYFFQPSNLYELSDRITSLLKNSDISKKADRALSEVRNFSWEKRAEKIVNF